MNIWDMGMGAIQQLIGEITQVIKYGYSSYGYSTYGENFNRITTTNDYNLSKILAMSILVAICAFIFTTLIYKFLHENNFTTTKKIF